MLAKAKNDHIGYLHEILWKKNVLCEKDDEITRFDGNSHRRTVSFFKSDHYRRKYFHNLLFTLSPEFPQKFSEFAHFVVRVCSLLTEGRREDIHYVASMLSIFSQLN